MDETKVALIALFIGVRVGDIAQLEPSKMHFLVIARTINSTVKRLGLDFPEVTPEEVDLVTQMIGSLVWLNLEEEVQCASGEGIR